MSSELSLKVLGELVHFTKYAKYLPTEKRRETFSENVDRNVAMHVNKYPQLKSEIEEVAGSFIKTKKILPSMRSMQFAGKAIELSHSRIYNCCYLPIEDWRSFSEIMFLLLGGTGVGYSVQYHHIRRLPRISKYNKTRRYVIQDTVIGWADAVKALMSAYLCGKSLPLFNFEDIRPKGAQLVTSGGLAPGPEPLKLCLDNIKAILDRKEIGSRLTSLEIHDICCHIAQSVFSGGIRRAAMICLFSMDDTEMLECKSQFPVKLLHKDPQLGGALCTLKYRDLEYIKFLSDWELRVLEGNGKLPWWTFEPQRGMSNNSANIVRHRVEKEDFFRFWDIVKSNQSGEPGMYLTNNPEYGCNPCFVGETLVAVADGRNAVSIEQLAKESQGVVEFPVYSAKRTLSSWKTEVKRAVAFKTGEREVVQVLLSNGNSFECTPEHKLALADGTYVEAQQSFGKRLERLDRAGLDLPVCVVAVQPTGETKSVYDLTVEDNHNFYIITSGDEDFNNSEGILVHNCVEIALKPYQFCNLCEINAGSITSQHDLEKRARAAAFYGTLQAGYTDFHYLRDVWQETTEQEALLGVSLTGVASLDYKQYDWEQAAEVVRLENIRVADIIGINPATRQTCIKPAGTTSLVLGTSSGAHAWFSKYYIRRMVFGKDESIYQYLKEKIPGLLEDKRGCPNEALVCIPVKIPDGAVVASEESALEFLERVKFFSESWIKPGHVQGDNQHNVSATVYVKSHEWEEVGQWMWDNKNHFNGLAVLPYSEAVFEQAPMEAITEEKYLEMVKLLSDLDLSEVRESDDNTTQVQELACAGGSCELVG